VSITSQRCELELTLVSFCIVSREALHHDEGNSKARLSLAELQLLKGELEACEHECVTLLRTDPGNEEATVVHNEVHV